MGGEHSRPGPKTRACRDEVRHLKHEPELDIPRALLGVSSAIVHPRGIGDREVGELTILLTLRAWCSTSTKCAFLPWADGFVLVAGETSGLSLS